MTSSRTCGDAGTRSKTGSQNCASSRAISPIHPPLWNCRWMYCRLANLRLRLPCRVTVVTTHPGGRAHMDLEEMAAIIEQLDKTDFTDFSYEKGDLRIRVKRGGTLADADLPPTENTGTPAEPATPTTATTEPTTPATVAAVQPRNDVVTVDAPMLGTFYMAPRPGEPPFVQIGQTVAAESTICIIEVMKLMNSIEAGVSGE